jgi:hypothetical protein
VVHEADELTQGGNEGDFGGLAGEAQSLVEPFELTMGAGGDDGGHVEGTTSGHVSAADTATAT